MSSSRFFPARGLALTLVVCFSAVSYADVGTGAPSDGLTLRFINAFFRNGFNNLVSLPPINNVLRFGSTGLVQEFQDASKTAGVKLALIRADANGPILENKQDVVQVLAPMYSYYVQVGVGTAGYPVNDTSGCPSFTGNSCQYQYFNKQYVLFAYTGTTVNGQNFAIRQNFYTKWVALGDISGLGRVTDTENAVTVNSVTATVQLFANGSVYDITSGNLSGKTLAVLNAVDQLYALSNREAGFLGLPTSDELVMPNGRKRQTFQGGAIEYDAANAPVILLPVSSVVLTPLSSGTLRMAVGDTYTLTAVTLSASGGDLPGRTITWTTSNSRVVAITPNGNTVTLKAAGAGNANITASSEGKLSPVINVSVNAQCCQIGEGAPSAAIQQAFQDAVTRNRLQIQLPAASAVKRAGNGYLQELFSTATPPVRYWIAKPDRVATAYVLSGDLLTRYEQLGGPSGSLGHPLSDATAGGRQIFENGALAGAPPRVVNGAILSKWSVLGYETGSAGSPLAEAASLVSSAAIPGVDQAFARGRFLAATGGPRAGQAFFVSGPILARFAALGGASGAFGLPVSDEYAADNRRRQNFEGGYFDYAPGDASATEHAAERHPQVSASPQTVVAGSRLRLSVSGFPDGSTLRVSVTGQADFVAAAKNGAFGWEVYVPLTAASATVRVQAADPASGASAETSYTVRALSESRLQLTKVQGDGQVGPPGAVLPQRLRVALKDESGAPVPGVAVTFSASPGAQVMSGGSAVTNDRGEAEAAVRLPSSEGISLVTAESVRVVSTFSLRSAAAQLNNFPRLTQSVDALLGGGPARIAQKGALLAAAASVVRYHQNRGEMSGPAADVASLNQTLKNYCAVDSGGGQVCDGFLSREGGDPVVNLWRVGAALGTAIDVSAETPDAATVRDLVAQGAPPIIALSLTSNDQPAGGHYVVAVGIAPDGGILIHDPNPAFGRSILGDYLAGFALGGRVWKGAIAAVLRLAPRSPSPTGFLLAAVSQVPGAQGPISLSADSPAGPCGRAVDLADSSPGPDGAATGRISRFSYCDGSQNFYQVTVGLAQTTLTATATDLSAGGRVFNLSGSGVTAYDATLSGAQWSLTPLKLSLATAGVVNAATFTPAIAPGGLAAVFGKGLTGSDGATAIDIDNISANVVGSTPFQANFALRPDLEPGTHTLRVRSSLGSAELALDVKPVAPAIFVLTPTQGAVVNQDGRLNNSLSPVRRGQVLILFATGLGAVNADGALARTREPVTVVLNGTELTAAFAGLAPGYAGLYQVNILIPAEQAPGLDVPLSLRQAGVDSNPVFVSIQ